jgi:hypothetical protein
VNVEQVEVPEYEKRTVVEGVISDLGSYVKIYEQGIPVKILDDAEIHIKNEGGVDYEIPFNENKYLSESADAITNTTYELEIVSEGQLITGNSTTPIIKYLIDTVKLNQQSGTLSIEFEEHTALNNFACIIYTINREQIAPYVLFSDEFHTGNRVIQNIGIPVQILPGDEIKITLYTINEESYDYLVDLIRIEEQYSDPQITHYNPQGNLSGNVLGYFMACLENTFTLTVEE